MFKEARKPSNDPLQEKLRENKAHWNKEVSIFIDNVINLKKLMNGWPSKFNMERSNIKDPIPADPTTILGVLAGDFQELAQKGNSLISQQADYSKNRKQKKSPGTNVPTLSQQLTASLLYELESVGSTNLSRFFSKVKGPWFGFGPEIRNKKYRMSILDSCADLNKQLKKFEQSILGSSPESIFIASKILEKIENKINFILNSITAYKSISTEEKTNSLNNNLKELDDAVLDFKKNYLNFTDLDAGLVADLNNNITKFEHADDSEKEQLSSIILEKYKAIISDFNRKNNTFAKTLGEALFAKKAYKSIQLEVLAQGLFGKWINKMKHQLSPFDKTSALRLDIYKISEESLKILNNIMDSLEKEFNVELLVNQINELYNSLSSIKLLMKPLQDIIKDNMFDKTFINLLKGNKISDYDFNLDKKQKEKLQNLLENRRIKELSYMYNKGK